MCWYAHVVIYVDVVVDVVDAVVLCVEFRCISHTVISDTDSAVTSGTCSWWVSLSTGVYAVFTVQLCSEVCGVGDGVGCVVGRTR